MSNNKKYNLSSQTSEGVSDSLPNKFQNGLSASQKAYASILNQILHFELLPGEQVSDYLLSERLNMSRTPIRDALLQLSTTGLVVTSGKKQFVAEMNSDILFEIFVLREAIECAALSFLISHNLVTADLICKLRTYNSKYNSLFESNYTKKDYFTAFENDAKLHELIVKSTNLKKLYAVFEDCSLQMLRFRWLTIMSADRTLNTVKEHENIISYLENKDEQKSLEALRAHIIRTRDNYCDILGKIPAEEWIRLIRAFSISEKGNK